MGSGGGYFYGYLDFDKVELCGCTQKRLSKPDSDYLFGHWTYGCYATYLCWTYTSWGWQMDFTTVLKDRSSGWLYTSWIRMMLRSSWIGIMLQGWSWWNTWYHMGRYNNSATISTMEDDEDFFHGIQRELSLALFLFLSLSGITSC